MRTEITDSQLVAGCLLGDLRAFDHLLARHYPDAVRTAQRYTALRDDAFDLAQEAFVTAHERLAQLQEPDKFGQWLAAIVRNQGLQWRRKRGTQPILTCFDDCDPDRGLSSRSAEQARASARRESVREAIAGSLAVLSEEQRRAVRLHYLDGYDYQETAELLGVPASSVRGRLESARRALKKELEQMTQIKKTGWELNARDLDAIRDAGRMARANDPERSALDTVLFTEAGEIVSTDTHRLFVYTSSNIQGIAQVLAHADMGRNLAERYPEARRARLLFQNGEAVLRLDSGDDIRTPIVDAAYPNWKAIIELEAGLTATARAGDWLEALDVLGRLPRPAPTSPEEEYEAVRTRIRFDPSESRVELSQGRRQSAEQPVAWEASASFEARFSDGSPLLSMGMNAQYLREAVEALRVAPDALVEFETVSAFTPTRLRPVGDASVYVITMPMQLNPTPAPPVETAAAAT